MLAGSWIIIVEKHFSAECASGGCSSRFLNGEFVLYTSF